MRRRRQAEEEQERSAEDGRASAIGAASLEINPSGRAGGDRVLRAGVWIRDNAGRREVLGQSWAAGTMAHLCSLVAFLPRSGNVEYRYQTKMLPRLEGYS